MSHKMSRMAHPMRLHGYAFQVVSVESARFARALRDAVDVPPVGMAIVAVDAGGAARQLLYCNHMPHHSTGIMTEIAGSA